MMGEYRKFDKFGFVFVTMTAIFVGTCSGCKRNLFGNTAMLSLYGFDDYSDPASMQRGDYLTSLLDSAPCPPVWKTELLCSSNSSLLCEETVFLLEKCLTPLKLRGVPLCHVLYRCESVLRCLKFLEKFGHDLLECRVPEEVSQHVTNSPTTQHHKTSVLLTKPTTYVDISQSTQYEGPNQGLPQRNSSIFFTDFKTSAANETTNTVQPPEAVKPPPAASTDGSAAAIVIVVLLLIILLLLLLFAVYVKRQKKYQITRRQWSTDSRSPLTRTEDGYDVCCFHWKRRNAAANKNACNYSSVPSSEQQYDNQSKPAVEIVLASLNPAESITTKDTTDSKSLKSVESTKDHFKEDLASNTQISCENENECGARESLEEEIFKSLETRNQGASRENTSSEDEGFGDLQNGNGSTDLTSEVNK